jgi:hypothetical protein
MSLTTPTKTRVPDATMAVARERWPATRDMTSGRILRYALALALGATEAEALAATIDPRKGRPRERRTTA